MNREFKAQLRQGQILAVCDACQERNVSYLWVAEGTLTLGSYGYPVLTFVSLVMMIMMIITMAMMTAYISTAIISTLPVTILNRFLRGDCLTWAS